MEVKKLGLWSQIALGSNSGSATCKMCDLEQYLKSGPQFPYLQDVESDSNIKSYRNY